jgi:hypothetical protein
MRTNGSSLRQAVQLKGTPTFFRGAVACAFNDSTLSRRPKNAEKRSQMLATESDISLGAKNQEIRAKMTFSNEKRSTAKP